MDKLLTISVAAYNVQAYLDQLMESVIASDAMERLEVLIVNDGSSDRTAEIGRGYEARFPGSVRLIDKPNGGHGSTINRGIREAKGKYFRALDGDDWVCPEHLAALLDRMEQIDADVILSDFCSFFEDGREELMEVENLTDGTMYSFEEIVSRIEKMRYHSVIYRTGLLQELNVTLDEHCFYVDTEFMLYPIVAIRSVYYAKPYLYCYRRGLEGQSISRAGRIKHLDNGFTVTESIIRFYREHAASLTSAQDTYIVRRIANHCLWHLKSIILCPQSAENKRRLVEYEAQIRRDAPACWRAMTKFGRESALLIALRATGYLAYGPICRYKSES